MEYTKYDTHLKTNVTSTLVQAFDTDCDMIHLKQNWSQKLHQFIPDKQRHTHSNDSKNKNKNTKDDCVHGKRDKNILIWN